MTQDEVRDLIDKYIIKNSMGAITAVIMRPILEEILNQPNALIGNLEYLDTLEKTTIVDSINSIVNGQIVEINAKILELIEKDVEQDQRLDLVEQHDRDQDGRLDSIENHDASQDVRLDGIELKNEEQDGEIALIHLKDNAQDIQIADLQNKDIEQDTRLTDIEGVNSNQDIEIQSLKNKDIYQDAEIQNLKDKDVLQDAEITDLDNRVDTLENKVATVYIPKGSVADITALFALTNQGIGWVYNLEDTGMNYVWLGGNNGDQGNGWDSLGGWVDFSEYYTRLEVDAKLDAIDLQRVMTNGNVTNKELQVNNQTGYIKTVINSSGVSVTDTLEAGSTSLTNENGKTILRNSNTNKIEINDNNVVLEKEVLGVDATQSKGLATLQQVTDLIEQGGGGSVPTLQEVIEAGNISTDGFTIGDPLTFAHTNIYPGVIIIPEQSGGGDVQMGLDGFRISSNIENLKLGSRGLLAFGRHDFTTIFKSDFIGFVFEYDSSERGLRVAQNEEGKGELYFDIPIGGQPATSPLHLVTLSQVEEKNFIVSADGSKWGIDDTGNTYKLP